MNGHQAALDDVGVRAMDSEKVDGDIEKLPTVLTLAQAARVAHKSRRTVRRWIEAGRIRGDQPDGTHGFYIDTRSLLDFIRPQ